MYIYVCVCVCEPRSKTLCCPKNACVCTYVNTAHARTHRKHAHMLTHTSRARRKAASSLNLSKNRPADKSDDKEVADTLQRTKKTTRS